MAEAPRESELRVGVSDVAADGSRTQRDDLLAVEEPMEIRVVHGRGEERRARSLSITMRTPGHDFELAVGFLFTEGIVRSAGQLRDIEFCGPAAPGRATSNIVRVELQEDVELDLPTLERNFYTTSSCGICGKASLDAVQLRGLTAPPRERPRLAPDVVRALPERLRAAQPVFQRTGGLHAAALADPGGALLALREDVGRHNAVDKLIGRSLLDDDVPLHDRVLVISGRAGFEILQKALAAGIAALVAVGAPSSLAVEMADRFGMTLVGFASRERFNVYTGAHRLELGD